MGQHMGETKRGGGEVVSRIISIQFHPKMSPSSSTSSISFQISEEIYLKQMH